MCSVELRRFHRVFHKPQRVSLSCASRQMCFGLTVSNRTSVVFYFPSRLCLHVLYSLDFVAIAYSHQELYIRQGVCPNNMVNSYSRNFMATDFFYTSPSPTFGSPSGWNGVETHKPSGLGKVELNSRVHSESLRSTNTTRETHT